MSSLSPLSMTKQPIYRLRIGACDTQENFIGNFCTGAESLSDNVVVSLFFKKIVDCKVRYDYCLQFTEFLKEIIQYGMAFGLYFFYSSASISLQGNRVHYSSCIPCITYSSLNDYGLLFVSCDITLLL